ncbi:MAG: hypothetical protein GF331_22955 [Chitinivibrionales bacterium]|nr:hypothetical protein [Chitinivibrionales bacterium]
MPNCKNCSAPLPANTLVCAYCGTRNDIDLRGIHQYTVEKPQSERICPRCDEPLRTIDLQIDEAFLIEQCEKCVGMFFDPGEVEALLEKSVSNVYVIDYSRIGQINKQKRHDEYPVGYVKCPVCRKFMNRVNFGHRSGVIVDRCRDHGVWLDGGELRHLMEWTKAGGQLLHQQAQRRNKEANERRRQRLERERQARVKRDRAHGYGGHGSSFFGAASHRRYDDDDTLLHLLTRAAGSLFG